MGLLFWICHVNFSVFFKTTISCTPVIYCANLAHKILFLLTAIYCAPFLPLYSFMHDIIFTVGTQGQNICISHFSYNRLVAETLRNSTQEVVYQTLTLVHNEIDSRSLADQLKSLFTWKVVRIRQALVTFWWEQHIPKLYLLRQPPFSLDDHSPVRQFFDYTSTKFQR